jgi:hypothetical protein
VRLIQIGLLILVIFSMRFLLKSYDKSFFISIRSVIMVFVLTSTSPLFYFLAVIFPGKLEASLAGTNLGVVIQALILTFASILVVINGLRTGNLQVVELSIIFLGTYVAWAAINGALLNQSWIGALSLVPLVLATAFGNFSMHDIELGLAWSLAIISSGALVIATFFDGLTQCRADKCLVFEYTFNFGGSQNGFSISVALLGIALVFVQRSFRRRLYVLCLVIPLAILGGSRTAVYTLVGIGLVQLFSTISQNYGLIRILHKITFIGSLGLSLLPLFMNFSDDAFTSRGVLWRSAKQLINDSPIIGNGQSYWTHQFSSQGFVANYGTHNIWLDNLVAFGFVGLSLFIFTLLSIRRRRVNSERYVLLATVFILGTTESSFQLWKLSGGMPFFLLILLFSKEAKSLIQASNNDKSTRRN